MALMIHHPTRGFTLLGSLIAAAFTITPIMANESSTVAASALQLKPIPAYRQFQDCTADLPDSLLCRILDAPVRSEVERRLGDCAATAWGSGVRRDRLSRAQNTLYGRGSAMGGRLSLCEHRAAVAGCARELERRPLRTFPGSGAGRIYIV